MTMKFYKMKLANKSSVSLMSLIGRHKSNVRTSKAAKLAGFNREDSAHIDETDRVAVIVESARPEETGELLDLSGAQPEALGGKFLSAEVGVAAAEALVGDDATRRIQTKKRNQLSLDAANVDAGRLDDSATPLIAETGDGVLIGVVDSGFDLSHPMFRDSGGNLRVEGLLDQSDGNRTFTTAQLESQWSAGTGPGADANGHGTHVASIAGGSRFGPYEGMAPKARFLLVKTDLINVDNAVKWIFDKAAANPCVVNLSLGNHFGAHDGTDTAERLYSAITGSGKIIVAAAGNERRSNLHIGGRFAKDESQSTSFDIRRQSNGSGVAVLTLWYDAKDRFDISLVTPLGQTLPVPGLGNAQVFNGPHIDIELSHKRYLPSALKQVQITIEISPMAMSTNWLKNWGLGMLCRRATVGRLDGWFHNSGFAAFNPSPLSETTRTVGIPATSAGVLSVASHSTDNEWDSDFGTQVDLTTVTGRVSPFSSRGPTRDGREKPDISAPGQYITAAMADQSQLAQRGDRADTTNRLATIEGTSMACPMVTGAIALMLQKRPTLTPKKIREIFEQTSTRDSHTGAANWTPDYGYGKLEALKAVQKA